jgi:glycine/D-amino acid oxidase-like deaminating enzyme
MGEKQQVGVYDDSQISTRVEAGLQTLLPSMFPNRFDQLQYTMSWTGIMAFTPDGNPFVGPVPNSQGLWVCAGFNGGANHVFFLSSHVFRWHC